MNSGHKGLEFIILKILNFVNKNDSTATYFLTNLTQMHKELHKVVLLITCVSNTPCFKHFRIDANAGISFLAVKKLKSRGYTNDTLFETDVFYCPINAAYKISDMKEKHISLLKNHAKVL